jgi:hypothetical protein
VVSSQGTFQLLGGSWFGGASGQQRLARSRQLTRKRIPGTKPDALMTKSETPELVVSPGWPAPGTEARIETAKSTRSHRRVGLAK